MNDSFEATMQGFMPRAPPTTQALMATNPWNSEDNTNRVLAPESRNFTPPTSYRAPTPGVTSGVTPTGSNAPPTSSHTAPVYSANGLAPGEFSSHVAAPSLSAVGASNLNTRANAGMSSRANAVNLTLNPSIINSASVNIGLGISRMPSSMSSGPTSSLDPTTSNSAASAHSSSAIAKIDWNHSAFSPRLSFANEANAQQKDYFRSNPIASSSTQQQQQGQTSIPGLLPNDIQNDTFVMDSEEGPEEIISELKLQVESLITAIVMSKPESGSMASSSALQGADGVEVAHRIMKRLKALRQENEYLGKLTNGTRVAELEAKTRVLEQENAMLKQQLLQRGETIFTD